MRIKSIHLTNYRCHKDLHVEFRPGFNVLVGVNGSGKTSLLKAISDAFWQPLFRVQGFKQKWDVSGVARLEKVFGGGRLRFEPQLPVIIDTVGVVSNRTYEWKSGPNDSLFVAEGSAFPPFQLETNSIGG